MTALVRLKLYSSLKLLDGYYITISIHTCKYWRTEQVRITYEWFSGRYDGLENYGCGLSRIVSEGPKFYAFVVRTPERRAYKICNIKGITLNYNKFLIVIFNSIRKLIMERERWEQEDEEEEKTTETVKSTF